MLTDYVNMEQMKNAIMSKLILCKRKKNLIFFRCHQMMITFKICRYLISKLVSSFRWNT